MKTNQKHNAVAKAATMALMEPLWPKVNAGENGILTSDEVQKILDNSAQHYPVKGYKAVLADECPDGLEVSHFVKPFDERSCEPYDKPKLIRNDERGNLVDRMMKMAGLCRLPIKAGSKLDGKEVHVSLGLRIDGEDYRLSPVRLARAVKHSLEAGGLKPQVIVCIKGDDDNDESCPF